MRRQERNALVLELIDAVVKSWWTIAAGICFGIAGALLALQLVEPLYVAKAGIYVTPELSRDLGRSPVVEDMTRRMAVLKESVISEESMRGLLAEVYEVEPSTDEQYDLWSRRVRGRIDIVPTAVHGTGADGLFGFEVAYRDNDARRAADAANAVAAMYIEQNRDFRSSQADEAARAARKAADLAKAEFEKIDAEYAQFRERHRFETGDHQDANLSLLQRRQDDLAGNLDAQGDQRENLETLRAELADVESGSSSFAQQMTTLRQRESDLLTRYNAAHPSVKEVRRQISELLRSRGVAAPDPDEEYPADPRISALREAIDRGERQLQTLVDRETELRGKIADLERRIDAVPRVQPRLTRLQTELQLARKTYEDADKKADETEQAAFMERELQGERFELAESARVPTRPVFPEPMPFFTLGVVGGLILFVGPLLARRVLNPVISSEAGLRALVDLPVLVTFPRVNTPATRGHRTRRTLKNALLSSLCLAVAVAAFVFLR